MSNDSNEVSNLGVVAAQSAIVQRSVEVLCRDLIPNAFFPSNHGFNIVQE